MQVGWEPSSTTFSAAAAAADDDDSCAGTDSSSIHLPTYLPTYLGVMMALQAKGGLGRPINIGVAVINSSFRTMGR